MASAFCFFIDTEVSWGSGMDLIYAHLPPTPPRGSTEGSTAEEKRRVPSMGDRGQDQSQRNLGSNPGSFMFHTGDLSLSKL